MPLSFELIILKIIGVTLLLGLHGLLYPRYLRRQIHRLARALEEYRHHGRMPAIQSSWPSALRELAAIIEATLMSFAKERARSRRREEILATYLSELCEQLGQPLNKSSDESAKPSPGNANVLYPPLERELEQVSRNVTNARNSIRDIIDLARIETNLLEPCPSDFYVSELARSLTHEFRTRAEQKHITFTVELVPNLPPVHADGNLIERALSHIVSYAIIDTPPGGNVAVLFEPSQTGVRISVRDTGQGEHASGAEHPFDQVYSMQSVSEHVDCAKPTIGLALTKCILDKHRSSLDVEKLPGHGTKVKFDLPRAAR